MPAPATFHTILVATDGSSSADIAVAHAIQVASDAPAKLLIVTAFDSNRSPISEQDAHDADARWLSDPQNFSDGVVAAAARDATAAGVEDVDTFTIAGDPADAILSVAEDNAVDLIVVGNKGMTGGRRFLLGSVPNKVSHHAPCSVLIVRTT